MTAATAPAQTAMKRLAGALAFVCLVLFLLAIEQRHTVAAWEAVRDGTGPAARRIADGAVGGFERLRSTVVRQTASWRASPDAAVGTGAAAAPEASPAAEPVPVAAGSLALVRAELRFGDGEVLHTRPLRIAAGRDVFAPGRTFAARWRAPADAQIELREVVAPAGGQAVPPSRLCDGEPARAAAILHRPDRIELMLFRTATVGPQTPATALCGVWSFPVQ